MICHTSLSRQFLPRPTPTPLKGVVVWQLQCRTCRTFAKPQVWQVWQLGHGGE